MKKRTLLAVAVVPLIISGLSGCEIKGGGDENIITIEFVKAGFGLTPYEKLKDAFEASHPEYSVKLLPNRAMDSDCAERVRNGGSSDVMIYNRSFNNIRKWANEGLIYDLKDDINVDIGGGKTIWSQLDDNGKKACEFDGGYYVIPEYLNINGFVYNATLFENQQWQVPKTSQELIDLCETISAATLGAGKKISPIAYSEGSDNADGYLYYADEGFASAYEGVDNLDKFYKMDSYDVYKADRNVGKLKGLELQNRLYNQKYSLAKVYTDFKKAQQSVFDLSAAMILNGSWFENEMATEIKSNPNTTIKIFPVPQVSNEDNEIIHADGYTCPADKDGVVSAEFTASMFIPKNAKNIKGAVEYLKWSSTPEACEIWTKYSNSVRPFNYDVSKTNPAYAQMSEFGKSVLDIANNYKVYVPQSTAKLTILGYGMFRPQGSYWFKKTLTDEYTPAECVTSDYDYAKKAWQGWLDEVEIAFKKD